MITNHVWACAIAVDERKDGVFRAMSHHAIPSKIDPNLCTKCAIVQLMMQLGEVEERLIELRKKLHDALMQEKYDVVYE